MDTEYSGAALMRPAGGRSFLGRIESVYLLILRVTILIIATILMGYAIWLMATSVYKISQSPSSIHEKTASVAVEEIAQAKASAQLQVQDQQPQVDPAQRHYYDGFVVRYYSLYRTQFQPYSHPDDKVLSKDEFDDFFIQSGARLDKIRAGGLGFESDKADLEDLLKVMSQASAQPAVRARLAHYKSAQKVQTAQQVQRFKVELRKGWDPYSTACPDWYESPTGCSVTRAVSIPYNETIYSMQYPQGTESNEAIFRALQERYFTLLNQRRADNAAEAEAARQAIADGNIAGRLSLVTALEVFGGFLMLMFFFLLIAIERHQRRLAAELASPPKPATAESV